METIHSEEFRQKLKKCLQSLDGQIRTLFLQNTGLAEVKEKLKQELGRLIQDHINLKIDTAAQNLNITRNIKKIVISVSSPYILHQPPVETLDELPSEKQTELPPATIAEIASQQISTPSSPEISFDYRPTQPSEVDRLRDEYGIKTEEIAEGSDNSFQLPNKRSFPISLPLLDKPLNANEIAQKESAVKGPWIFDAIEQSKPHDIKQLKKLILPSDNFFRLKRIKSDKFKSSIHGARVKLSTKHFVPVDNTKQYPDDPNHYVTPQTNPKKDSAVKVERKSQRQTLPKTIENLLYDISSRVDS